MSFTSLTLGIVFTFAAWLSHRRLGGLGQRDGARSSLSLSPLHQGTTGGWRVGRALALALVMSVCAFPVAASAATAGENSALVARSRPEATELAGGQIPVQQPAASYTTRQAKAKNLERFEGGDTTVVIGGSALVIILVVVLIVILL